jgi:hypothetical protein
MAPRMEDSFVFDLKNALRFWLSEAVARGEVAVKDAEDSIRNIDPAKVIDTAEDYIKLLTGTVKDSFGSVGIAAKLVKDFNKWWGVSVYFKPGAQVDLVIFKGWPNGRQLLSASHYRVDNPKIIELQIGRPGIQAAAKESAKFGIYLVVAVDVIQFIRDGNLAHLLGSLTVDIPSVMLASAIGAVAGTLAVGSAAIGTIALGPALVAFGVGVLVGIGLFWLDKHFELTDKVTAAYERGLDRLARWWKQFGPEASKRWNEFVNSGLVQDMEKDVSSIGERLGQGDNALYMFQSVM